MPAEFVAPVDLAMTSGDFTVVADPAVVGGWLVVLNGERMTLTYQQQAFAYERAREFAQWRDEVNEGNVLVVTSVSSGGVAPSSTVISPLSSGEIISGGTVVGGGFVTSTTDEPSASGSTTSATSVTA